MTEEGRRAEGLPIRKRPTTLPKQKARPVPTPVDPRPVSISGTLTENLSLVAQTNASLHLITGRLQTEDGLPGEKVLLPFAEFRIGGGMADEVRDMNEEGEPKTLFAATLTLENMAFMVLDLASDLRRVCDEAAGLAKSELAVDGTRMAHVRYFVAHLERQAASCRRRLDLAFGEPKSEAEG